LGLINQIFALYLQIKSRIIGFALGIAAASFCAAIAEQKIQRKARPTMERQWNCGNAQKIDKIRA
jgi:DNA-binding transcriptional regulator WhiA